MKNVSITDIGIARPAGLDQLPVDDYPFMKVLGCGARPAYGSRDAFFSADRRFNVGYSEYTIMTLELRDWPADEFMYFIEGQVQITDLAGRSKTYGPGDMIVMPKGFSGTWKQLSPIRKISATYGWCE